MPIGLALSAGAMRVLGMRHELPIFSNYRRKKVGQNSRNEKLLIFKVDIKYELACTPKNV